MSSILINAAAKGYSSRTVLNHLIKKYPQYATQIQAAEAAGYTADRILKHLARDKSNGDSTDQYLTEYERTQRRDKNNRRNAALGLGAAVVGTLGTAGALASAGMQYAARNRAIQPSQILPAPPRQGPTPQGPVTLQGRGPRGPMVPHGGNIAGQQQKGIGYNPQKPPQGSAPSPRSPRGQPPAPSTPNAPIIPPYEHDPQTNIALVKNIREDKRISDALASGLGIAAVEQALRQTIPKSKLALLDRAPGGFQQVLQDYAEGQLSETGRQDALQEFNRRRERPPSLLEQERERFTQGYGDQLEQIEPEQMELPLEQAQEMQQMPQNNILKDFAENQMKAHQKSKKTKLFDAELLKAQQMPLSIRNKTEDEERPFLDYQPGEEFTRKQKLNNYIEFLNEQEKSFAEDKLKELSNRDKELSKEIEGIKKRQHPEFSLERHESLKKGNQDALIAIKIHLGKPLSVQEKEILSSMDEPEKIHAEITPEITEVANTFVLTPLGAAEVKHDGKAGIIAKTPSGEKSFKHEDVEQVPQDVIQAVSNILQIPEVDRSSNIALFLYNPADKEMYFQFHDGTAYKYYDMDPDKVFRLAEKMHIPITTGENVFGAWSPEDKKSLGASFYQEILKDPKYAKPKKGEPANPYYRKMETMYDYWEKLRKKPTPRKAKKKDV